MSSPKFNPVSIIRKKRAGEQLSGQEIRFMIWEYTKDLIPDYQLSAFLMAGFLQGFDEKEASALTDAMLHSGEVLDFGDIPGIKVDKHSTGGVGDKLSLILAPIVASCGIPVPMISGRGLGHTGGTLDKLESIKGFKVDMSLDRFRQILGKTGLVMAGQTEEIAPADKRLYALRDVTATIESIPLIASSIMSKKLAEGIDALVLDVKVGSGAFMSSVEEATELAETLLAIGGDFGIETIAYLTDMNQPLGRNIGNWLEVEEAIDALRGAGPDDVMEITHTLAGTMIFLGGKAASIEAGVAESRRAIRDGSAWRKWLEVVEEQGGDCSLIEHPETYPAAAHEIQVKAVRDGFIESFDAYEIGMASLELGAGRKQKEDRVDPAAGIILEKKIGSRVKQDETIARCYTNNISVTEAVTEKVSRAVSIGTKQTGVTGLIKCKVDKTGIHAIKT